MLFFTAAVENEQFISIMMEQATESAYQIPAGFEWMIEWVCLYIKNPDILIENENFSRFWKIHIQKLRGSVF